MRENDFLSAVIVTYNDAAAALRACESLLAHTVRYPLTLYVIDNASSDGTKEALSTLDGVTYIQNDKNIGFGAAHNMALTLPLGKYHFVVNPDIEISSDVLCDMVDFMEDNPDTVMSMPRILNEDGSEQYLPKEKPSFKRLYFGRIFKKIRSEFVWADKPLGDVTDIRFCSGCFFCMPDGIFQKLKGFDKRYFMYLEDADLTLRALQEGRVVINPHFQVTHLWHRQSAKSLKYLLIHISSSLKFLFKWRKF